MNIPGHTGVTLGAFYLGGYLFDAALTRGYRIGPLSFSTGRWGRAFRVVPRALEQIQLDHRGIFLGSLLPDVIDKPMGLIILPELLGANGRTIGHTLLFNLLLLALGVVLLRSMRSYTPLVLALSSAGHLAMDQMWQTPETLFWPLLGLEFPVRETTLARFFAYQLSGGWIAPPQIIGFLVLCAFAFLLYQRRSFFLFLKRGRVKERIVDRA